jgi:hypothetical protein
LIESFSAGPRIDALFDDGLPPAARLIFRQRKPAAAMCRGTTETLLLAGVVIYGQLIDGSSFCPAIGRIDDLSKKLVGFGAAGFAVNVLATGTTEAARGHPWMSFFKDDDLLCALPDLLKQGDENTRPQIGEMTCVLLSNSQAEKSHPLPIFAKEFAAPSAPVHATASPITSPTCSSAPLPQLVIHCRAVRPSFGIKRALASYWCSRRFSI